jgi:diguanylate cyclase (GGDEF)-like protein/PAS domain S-box-containing protein
MVDIMREFISGQMDYIYFFYGLAFIILAAVCFSMRGKQKNVLPWWWLGMFGLIHGINGWFDLLVLAFSIAESPTFAVIRLFFVVASFLFLLEFARKGTIHVRGKGPGQWVIVLLFLLSFVGVSVGWQGFNVTVRYVLGAIGALWSSLVLFLAAGSQNTKLRRCLLAAGLIFGLYGCAVVLGVPKASFFPANILNQDVFLDVTGVPIQLVRGGLAILIATAIACWNSRLSPEIEIGIDDEKRVIQLQSMYMVRVAMVTFVIIVAGWLTTEVAGRYGNNQGIANLTYRVMMIHDSIEAEQVDVFIQNYDSKKVQQTDYLLDGIKTAFNASSNLKNVYIVSIIKGKLVVLVSANRDGLARISGQPVIQQEIEKGLRDSKSFVTKPYLVGTDNIISGFAPVINKESGKTIAFLGVDMDAKKFWTLEIAPYRLTIIIGVLVLNLLVLLIYISWQRNQELIMQKTALKLAGVRADNEKRLRNITSTLGEGVYVVDEKGDFTFLNPEAEKLLGWKESELLGKKADDVIQYQNSDGLRVSVKNRVVLNDVNSGATNRNNDGYFTCKDGTVFPVLYVSSPLVEDGKLLGSVMAFQDITKQKQAEEKIKHMAYYDQLTDLPNRALFNDRLNLAMAHAHRNGLLMALLFIDLDRFKNVNDSLGHDIGDKLLQDVSDKLIDSICENGTVARFGGDEFMLLLPEIVGIEDAIKVAERILISLNKPSKIDNMEIHITPSIGIVLYPNDGLDVDTLVKNADAAMYRAKEEGKNNYQLYTSEMNAKALEQIKLENSLRRAIDNQEFILHYQPQIDIASRSVKGVEALVRWKSPERGLVPPGEVIPVAEEMGLIVRLGEWVLRTACAQNVEWQRAGLPHLKMAVNISAKQLKQKNFVERVERILEETQLKAKYLELEITESVSMKDIDKTLDIVKRLKEIGVSFAIDDFGTGYSSMNYLRNFPIVDVIKIDSSFIRDITPNIDEPATAIVGAMIVLAKSLRMKIIAEGVETEEQMEILRNYDCDEMQGFHFSRPLSADQMSEFLKTWV